MAYIIIALVCLVGLYISMGLIFDKENYRIVTRRRELMAELSELRRSAWRQGINTEVSSTIEVRGISFSPDVIGFGEEHIIEGLKENISNGKQDEELLHVVSDDICRKAVRNYFLIHWPRMLAVLPGYRVMLKYFEEYVKVTYPRQLQTAMIRKKMIHQTL
jgi:hypothetical protein